MQSRTTGFTTLTDLYLRSIAASGKEFEQNESRGFGIRVSPKGKVTFQARYWRHGKKQRLTLGTYPETSLRTARVRFAEARKLIDAGTDPIIHQREQRAAEEIARQERHAALTAAAQAETVLDLAKEWMSRYVDKERKRPEQVRQVLFGSERNRQFGLLHTIGMLKARDISRRDVVRALDEIVNRAAPIQANRAASIVKQLFQYGVERGVIDTNPCADIRRRTIGGSEPGRDRTLNAQEITILWHALETMSKPVIRDKNPAPGRKLLPEEKKKAWISRRSALALQILLLTAQRRGELSNARWEHIDFDECTWIIPAAHAKNGKEHKVPLSSQAVALFEQLHAITGDNRHVLPCVDGTEAISERVLTKSAERIRSALNIPHWVPHDLRRTAATQMADLGVLPHVVEKILNHTMQGVMGIYNRHDYFEDCRLGLQLWGDRVDQLLRETRGQVAPGCSGAQDERPISVTRRPEVQFV